MIAPYYADDMCSIYHGDALEIMDALGSECVDIVVTSPPYNMGLTPGGNGRGLYKHTTQKAHRFGDGYDVEGDDSMPYDEYCDWQRDAITLMTKCAKRAVFYNHRPRVMHGNLVLPLDGDYGLDPDSDITLRQIIIWDRMTGIDVNLRHFCTRQEWVLLFAWPDFRLKDHAASGMGDVWRLGMDHSGVDHPAPFPISLPTRCIDSTGARSVLDPFMGSGTTLVAAKAGGVKAIGIEKVERYCEMAVDRLAQGSLFGATA